MKNIPHKDSVNTLKKFDMMSDTGKSTGLVFVGEKTENHSKMIALEYAEKYRVKISSPVHRTRKDKLKKEDIKPVIAKFVSVNSRKNDSVTLFHLWAELNKS